MRTVPHWCEGVRRSNGFDENDRIAGGAQSLLEGLDESLVSAPVAAPPVEPDLPAFHRHAAFRVRQVLAHRVPVDRAPAHEIESPFRRSRNARLQDWRGHPAKQLDVAERRSAAPVIEIEIVDAERLLVDGVVDRTRVDRQHRRAIVIHEMSADRARAIGDAAFAGGEKQSGGVHRAGGKDDDPSGYRFAFPGNRSFHAA